MKKYLSTIFIMLLVSAWSFARAQEKPQLELNVSAGGPGLMPNQMGGPESYFSLSGEVRFYPDRWLSFGLIGGLSHGNGIPGHGAQFTPIGLSYGGRLFGFAELGLGWAYSPARAGIGYRF